MLSLAEAIGHQRGGVPVFKRPCGTPALSAALTGNNGRADHPRGLRCVVLQAHECARPGGASRSAPPPAPENNAHLVMAPTTRVALDHQVVHRLLEQPQVGLVLQRRQMAALYKMRSAWARVARTAGPLLEFRMRN